MGGRYYLTKTKSTAEESRPGEIQMDSGRWEAVELSDIAEKRPSQSRHFEVQGTKEGRNELGLRSCIWSFDSPGPLLLP